MLFSIKHLLLFHKNHYPCNQQSPFLTIKPPQYFAEKSPFGWLQTGFLNNYWGERGIRTLGTIARALDFESSPFDHSGISPKNAAKMRSFFEKLLFVRTFFENLFLQKPFILRGPLMGLKVKNHNSNQSKTLIFKVLHIHHSSFIIHHYFSFSNFSFPVRYGATQS